MKTHNHQYVLVYFLVCTMLAACGPSQAELEATAAQAVANDSATQTAQALTVTPTFTPSPTATATLPPSPTATNTPVPTFTPRPTRTPRPTPFGGGAQIAFTSNRDGNYEIYTMNSDGSNQIRLTNSQTTEDFFPEFFPDGKMLLYFSASGGSQIITRLSWIMTDGSEQGVFSDGVGGYSSVSRDGLVALMIFTEYGGADIGVVSAGGGNVVRLTDDPGKDGDPCWSPDGQTIAFVSDREGPNNIYLMDQDGSNQRRLINSMFQFTNQLEPAWSPDGSTIAFLIADQTDTSNLYLINPDGTNMRPLTEEVGSYNENPVWSPDGTLIAFWSNRTGNREIFAVKVDGSEPINLTNKPGDDENPSWSK